MKSSIAVVMTTAPDISQIEAPQPSYARELQRAAEHAYLHYANQCFRHRVVIDQFATWLARARSNNPFLAGWQRTVYGLEYGSDCVPGIVYSVKLSDYAFDIRRDLYALSTLIDDRLMFSRSGGYLTATVHVAGLGRMAIMLTDVDDALAGVLDVFITRS